ncbi:MAG: plasmid pRiA4b ORF-3 family protein [Acidobacteria bacterium]|nr:plasmid pRiA4b ORF-3 family protein [Acidobacteriota bacterium]
MRARRNRRLFQFKVTLRGISPPIWRQIQVWEDYTLAQLHRVLQVVMGWENYHLYEFRIGGKPYGPPDPEFGRKIIDAKRTRMRAVLPSVGIHFEYVYDLGDYWQHDLFLEGSPQPASDLTYPRCVAGERNCPPEDVGGPRGYEDYLQAMADPSHEQHEEMMAWRCPFDPEAFSVEDVNWKLARMFRNTRKRGGGSSIPEPIAAWRTGRTEQELRQLLEGIEAFLLARELPQKERIRIKPNETVPLELSERERELILSETFADEELTNRLRVVPKRGERAVFRYTLDDLDELAGCVAAEANHAKDKKLKKEWDQLFHRIHSTLDRYVDEEV